MCWQVLLQSQYCQRTVFIYWTAELRRYFLGDDSSFFFIIIFVLLDAKLTLIKIL